MPVPLNADFSLWIEALIVIGIGVTVIACLGALAERLVRDAVWQRTLWQTALLAILGLVAVQVTGLRAGLLFSWNRPAESVAADASIPQINSTESPTEFLVYEAASPTGAEFEITDTPPAAVTEPAELESRSAATWNDRMAPLLPVALLLGSTMCLLRIVWGRLLLFVLTRRCVRAEAGLDEQLRSISRALGIRRRVWLWMARAVRGPLAFGTLRPTIVVPETFAAAFDRSRRQVILAHELAHLAAFDPFWQGLANATCAVLWWHPMAWWMRRRLRSVSEAAADEASLLMPDGPELLAGCLVEMGRRLVQPARVPGLSVEGSGFRSELGRRVERLLALESRTWSTPRRLPLMIVKSILPPVLVLAAISCTAWAEPGLSLVQPAEGDATMNVWKSSWRGSLAATALCALWNPAAMADERPAAEAPARVESVQYVPVEISGETIEVRTEPRPGAVVRFVKPEVNFYYAQTTDEQTARNRGQLDRARQVADEQARKDRRERLERQQALTQKLLEGYKKLDALGEGHDAERKELNEQLERAESELRGTLEPAAGVRFWKVDAREATPAPPDAAAGDVFRLRAAEPIQGDEARLNELKRAVADLEAAMTQKRRTATRSNRMYVRSAPQWGRSGIIKKVGADAGNPVELSIDMQDGTILGLEKLGDGVQLTLRGKPTKLDELKSGMPVALTWIPYERGWKLHIIDAEPQPRTEVLYEPVPQLQLRAVPRAPVPHPGREAPRWEVAPNPSVAPPPGAIVRPGPRTDPNPRDRNAQELEGQVEKMRGQMDELQKQISELRDLLKQKAEAEPRRN